MYTIVVDCMGSDNGSKATVGGIISFLKGKDDVKIVAVGKEEELQELKNYSNVEIIDARDVVPMAIGPMEVMRVRNSSMYKAIMTMKDNNYDAVVSAGSTGGFLSLATIKLRTIEGIQRAALVTPMPTKIGKPVTLLDCGANNEITAEHLVQFANMGKIYSEKVLHNENPSIYLLSNGTEDEKGTPEIKEANKLLHEMNFPGFKGNVEARDALSGECDVIVTGGFAGNIFLKSVEGTAKMMSGMIKKAFKRNFFSKLGYLFSKKGFVDMKKSMNYETYGGAMLLGVNGVVVKAHGNSSSYSFSCAIDIAYKMSKEHVVDLLKEGVTKSEGN